MSFDLSRFSSLPSTLLLASLLVACGGGGDDDDGVSASCAEADQHDDLAWIQENIFNVSCALSPSCHLGDATMAQGLNLEAGNAEANLVNVMAKGDFADGLDLVEPGQPTMSYLLIIMGQYGEDDPRIPDTTGVMPYNSGGPLCEQKRNAIQRWIEGL
jgi:hypothetical protein